MTHSLAAKASPDEITDNELAWVEFLRMLSGHQDPAPSLAAIQALRAVFEGRHAAT